MYIKNDYLPTVAIINIDFDKLPLKVDNFEKHISQMHKRYCYGIFIFSGLVNWLGSPGFIALLVQ